MASKSGIKAILKNITYLGRNIHYFTLPFAVTSIISHLKKHRNKSYSVTTRKIKVKTTV